MLCASAWTCGGEPAPVTPPAASTPLSQAPVWPCPLRSHRKWRGAPALTVRFGARFRGRARSAQADELDGQVPLVLEPSGQTGHVVAHVGQRLDSLVGQRILD